MTHAAASGDSGYNALTVDAVTVTVTDNDTAGVTVPSAPINVVEGGTGTYTVVLASQPSASVTVTPTSGNESAVTVPPTVLTFTTGDWDTAQTVTVTAVQDTNAVSEEVQVTHTAASGDSGYNSLTVDAVTVTVTDNDTAGVTVPSAPINVVEGGTGTYTVVLASQPSASVTVTPTSADPTAVTVPPTVLTFTTGDWDTAQTVTVTAVEDTNAVSEEVQVTHAAASGDSGYNSLTVDAVTVTVTDNDTAGVTVPSAPINVVEGGTGTYTVVLASQPSASVTVTPTSGNESAVTVPPTVLTFTTGDWDTAQTVTVTAVQDVNAVSEEVQVTHAAASGDTGYNSLTVDAVTVTVTDNDTAGVTVPSAPINVVEGGTGTYTVVLASQPSASVTVTPTSGNESAVTVPPTVLTFTTGDWSTAQTVTVTAVEDTNAVSEEVQVTHTAASGDTGYNSLTVDAVTVTVTDNDTAGVTVPSAPINVVEGGTGTYTVVLASQPSASVTVTPTSGNESAVTVPPTVLTFTTGDWSTAQTVTVTAVEDTNAVSEEVQVTHTAASGDTGYNSLTVDAVTVTVTDNDEAEVTVFFGANAYSVSEDGTTVSVTVELSAVPGRRVVIPITVTNQGDTSADDYTTVPSTVTFAADATEQSFTFAAVDDTVDDDGESVVLSFGAMPDDKVEAGVPATATVTIDDNDTAGVVVVPDTGLSFEDGTATYTISLGSQPTDVVTVTVTVSLISSVTRASFTPSVISSVTRASFTPSVISSVTRASFTPSVISSATRASFTPSVISSATRASFTPSVISSATRAWYTPSVISSATRAWYTPSLISSTTRAWYTPSLISSTTRAPYTPSLISSATRVWYTPSLISSATRAPYTLVAADVTEFLKASVSPDGVTVMPMVLTFTTDNWDTPQTVTVRDVDGIVTDDDTIEVSHTVTSDDADYKNLPTTKQTVRAEPLEIDPALSVGPLGLYWENFGENINIGNTLTGSLCTTDRSFYIIWTGPAGNNTMADEWAAKISINRGVEEVTYNFRETPGDPGNYEMYGTVRFSGDGGSLSINVRGRFGKKWGDWSPTGSLYCWEMYQP